MRFAELDGVTLDAYGTLLALVDPVPRLTAALRARRVERSADEVSAAFAAEVAYYRPRSLEGRDPESLARLRRDCTGVFLDALGAGLDPAEFAGPFVEALRFRPLTGVVDTLARLRALGLELAVVANWDASLGERLSESGLDRFFSVAISSAEAGAEKPDPAVFRMALERIGVAPGRALHVGDEPVDEEGARLAGLRFAAAPLGLAFEGWR